SILVAEVTKSDSFLGLVPLNFNIFEGENKIGAAILLVSGDHGLLVAEVKYSDGFSFVVADFVPPKVESFGSFSFGIIRISVRSRLSIISFGYGSLFWISFGKAETSCHYVLSVWRLIGGSK
ncbi:unnamed protein product, partial [Prunus brigantina]